LKDLDAPVLPTLTASLDAAAAPALIMSTIGSQDFSGLPQEESNIGIDNLSVHDR
jgi:hypothetical protein